MNSCCSATIANPYTTISMRYCQHYETWWLRKTKRCTCGAVMYDYREMGKEDAKWLGWSRSILPPVSLWFHIKMVWKIFKKRRNVK